MRQALPLLDRKELESGFALRFFLTGLMRESLDGTGRWSQQFINTVCSLAVECSRRNSSVVDVKCLLKDDTGRLAKAFTQAYEVRQQSTRLNQC